VARCWVYDMHMMGVFNAQLLPRQSWSDEQQASIVAAPTLQPAPLLHF
jgi:hypothetical protein